MQKSYKINKKKQSHLILTRRNVKKNYSQKIQSIIKMMHLMMIKMIKMDNIEMLETLKEK